MTLPPPVAEHALSELVALATAEGSERELVERLLEAARRECESPGLGLYLAVEGGWRLEVTSGESSLPERLTDDEAVAYPGIGLPQALVVCSRAAREAAPLPRLSAMLLASLALATRCLRLQLQVREQGFAARTRGLELEALYDVGLAIASTLDFDRLCEEVLMRALSLLDARRGALYLLEGETLRLHRLLGDEAPATLDAADPAVRRLLRQQDSELVSRILPGSSYQLALPMPADGEPKGLIVVADKETRRGIGPFRDTDRRTLGLLANQAAIALANANLHRQALEKERLQREMELASEIQRRLLPKGVPLVPGYALAGWSRPARHVGGDYFDFLDLSGGSIGITLGDVSGKGVAAALLVSTLHSALRLLLDSIDVGPALFARLNQHLLEWSAPNRFVTLFLAELEPTSGALTYLNAGHNPALLVRACGEVERLPAGGLPLGLLPGVSFRPERLDLGRGDLLCLYSDGITEASSANDEEFGLWRLTSLLGERRGDTLDSIVAAIDEEVSTFADAAPQGDDQTVVLLRREPA